MSFTAERREQIREYILDGIAAHRGEVPRRTADAFQISRNSVYRYLKEMSDEGLIQKVKGEYRLTEYQVQFTIPFQPGTEAFEDRVFRTQVLPELTGLSENALSIWAYAFTEMMNNAMDHAEATEIQVSLMRDYVNTSISIRDNGIGIFRKIKCCFQLESEEEACGELFKGKTTTNTAQHSGEGIFFTSRLMDLFFVVSGNVVFTRSRYEALSEAPEYLPGRERMKEEDGTLVYMRLANNTKKTSKGIFDEFASPDGGFTKTEIPLKHYFEMWPVSRSQAKRLTRRMERFSEAVLDFSDIPEIGQGFAHELFVVWTNAHPETRLIPVNVSEDVARMIRRAQRQE